MYTLRCTRKLLRRIDERPSSEVVSPTTVLGDWYANLLYLRPQQLVLAMNERTLLCALVPAAPAATVAERLRLEVGGLLRDIGVPEAMVEAEFASMEHVAIGATASRAVLGCRTMRCISSVRTRVAGGANSTGGQLAANGSRSCSAVGPAASAWPRRSPQCGSALSWPSPHAAHAFCGRWRGRVCILLT